MSNWISILYERRGAIAVGVIAFLVAFFALWLIPIWQVEQQVGGPNESVVSETTAAPVKSGTPKDKPTLINEYRRTLAQSLGGFALLVGFYLTWRTLTNSERNTSIAREGQITERFTRAVDQLGAVDDKGGKRLEIRLGGIYALERIARDSERDHWTVMEILTTYIRENSPKEATPWRASTPPIAPSADIQAILYVLKRRDISYENRDGAEQKLNLNGTNLRGADLRGAHLEYANIVEAQLEGAFLTKAYLEQADLTCTSLWDVDLRGAHLEGTSVHNSDMTDTDVRNTDLSKVIGLAQWQIDVMKKDDETRFPEQISTDTPGNILGG